MVLLIALGAYGALLSAKYYERFRLHVCRVGRTMEHLEDLEPDANMRQIETLAKQKHKPRHPHMSKVRLHRLWIWLHLGITVVGIINVILIALKWQSG